MKIILASGSPRRKELLGLIVPEFEVQVSGVDESLEEGLTPSEQVTRLAYIKAKDVFDKTLDMSNIMLWSKRDVESAVCNWLYERGLKK